MWWKTRVFVEWGLAGFTKVISLLSKGSYQENKDMVP